MSKALRPIYGYAIAERFYANGPEHLRCHICRSRNAAIAEWKITWIDPHQAWRRARRKGLVRVVRVQMKAVELTNL